MIFEIKRFLFDIDSDAGSDASDTGNDREDKTGGHSYDRETGTMNHADGSKDRWNHEKGGWDHYDKDGNFTGNDKDPKDGGNASSGDSGSSGSSSGAGDKEDHGKDNGSGGSSSSGGGSTSSGSTSSGGPSSGGSYGGTDLSSGSQTEGAQQASEKAKQDYDKAMNQLGADIGAAEAAEQAAKEAQQAADKAKQQAAKDQAAAEAAKQKAQEAQERYKEAIDNYNKTQAAKEQAEKDLQAAKDKLAEEGVSNVTTETDVYSGKTKVEADVSITNTATGETYSAKIEATVENGVVTEATVNGKPANPADLQGGTYKDIADMATAAQEASYQETVAGTQANIHDKAAQEAQAAAEAAAQAQAQAQQSAQNAAAAQNAANQAAQNAAAAQTALGNSAAAAENAASAMDKAKEAQEAAAGKSSETLAGGEKEKEEALNKELDKILGGDEETPPDGETPPEGSTGGNHQTATDKINDNADKVTNQMQDVLITGSFNDFVSQLITIDWLSGPDKESVLNQMDELAQYDNRTHEKVMDTLKDFVANIKQISASPTLTYFERIKAYITEIGDFFKECMSALKDSQFARALTLGFSLLRIAFTVMVMVALPQAAIPILGGFLVRWGWHAIKQGIKSDWKPEELGFKDGYDNAHQQWSKDFTIMGDDVFGNSEDPLNELKPNKYNVQQSNNYAGYNNGLVANVYSDEDVKSFIIKVTRKSPIVRKLVMEK